MQKKVFFAALVAISAGCAVGPDYKRPQVEMPQNFEDAALDKTLEGAGKQDLTEWWKSYSDPELDRLIEAAIESNPSLAIAAARLQQARAEEAVARGGLFPAMEFSGAAARGTGTNSTKGRISAPLNAATNTTGLREITEVAGFDAAWEVDLFGHLRRKLEAARADTQAAAEAHDAALVSLLSDVTRAYIELRAQQLRLSIANDQIHAQQQTVDLMRIRFSRGITNELDYTLAQRQLETARSTVQPLEAGIAQARRRIAVLLGKFPEELGSDLTQQVSLPKAPEAIAPGLPVDLLRRRPDVREAERELAAATARVGVATADLFPRVVITGGFGLQGQGMGRTPVDTSSIWSAGPAVYWPLLDFGTLDALIKLQEFRSQELAINYKKTILTAVEEVDNAINNFSAEQSRRKSLESALRLSQRAVKLASERYDRGLTDFLNVLDAQRQMFELQDQDAAAQQALLIQSIAVYKALGSGWETKVKQAPISAPQPAVMKAISIALAPRIAP